MSLAEKYIETLRQKRHVTFADNDEDSLKSGTFSTKWLTTKEIARLEVETGLACKKGKFSTTESSKIHNFVTKHFENKETDYQLFLDHLVTRKNKFQETFGNFFVDVTRLLNNGRPVVSVYSHIRRLFHPNNHAGRWQPAEDAQLKRLVALHGPKWEVIGKVLEKLPINCRDRYKNIRENYSKGKWTEEEEEKLTSIIKNLTQDGTRPARGLWIVASELMGTRSMVKCFEKWNYKMIYKNRQAPLHFWSRFEDFRLVSVLYEQCVSEESEFVWRNIADPSTTHRSSISCHARWSILKKRIPRRIMLQNDLDLVLEELLRQLHPGDEAWQETIDH